LKAEVGNRYFISSVATAPAIVKFNSGATAAVTE